MSALILTLPIWPLMLHLDIVGSWIAFAWLGVIVCILGIGGGYEALRSRVVTSPNGIAYYSVLYRIESTWSNVKSFTQNEYGFVNLVLDWTLSITY